MSRRIELYATVKKGVLKFLDVPLSKAVLWRFKDNEVFVVTISKKTKNRSSNQNRYYRGVVLVTIAEYTGEDENDLHEHFKRMFLQPVEKQMFGKVYKVPGSTTMLSTTEMFEYIERIRAFMAQEYGVSIPDPDVEWNKK